MEVIDFRVFPVAPIATTITFKSLSSQLLHHLPPPPPSSSSSSLHYPLSHFQAMASQLPGFQGH
jgi:hypothetical protein